MDFAADAELPGIIVLILMTSKREFPSLWASGTSAPAFERVEKKETCRHNWLIVLLHCITISGCVGRLEAAGRAIRWQHRRNSDYLEVVMFCCCCFGPAESPVAPSHSHALIMTRFAEAHLGDTRAPERDGRK